LRHAVVLKDSTNNTLNSSDSFNLGSTRTITYSSGGNKTVRFMLTKLKTDTGTECFIYNAVFSVTIP
jgi:hypothetical protein